jgi:hypothetical protein
MASLRVTYLVVMDYLKKSLCNTHVHLLQTFSKYKIENTSLKKNVKEKMLHKLLYYKNTIGLFLRIL